MKGAARYYYFAACLAAAVLGLTASPGSFDFRVSWTGLLFATVVAVLVPAIWCSAWYAMEVASRYLPTKWGVRRGGFNYNVTSAEKVLCLFVICFGSGYLVQQIIRPAGDVLRALACISGGSLFLCTRMLSCSFIAWSRRKRLPAVECR
jgi:hypothetical protein